MSRNAIANDVVEALDNWEKKMAKDGYESKDSG